MFVDGTVVLALDDDIAVLTSLGRLLDAHGYAARLHQSVDDMLQAGLPDRPACLLLDQQLGNGMTGVAVHADLQRRGWDLPVIFLTAHWNVQLVVDTMRAGADGFLTKPYDPAALIREIDRALDVARQKRAAADESAAARVCAATLTPREHTVTTMVLAGLPNKQIADQLGLALVTVKLHRGNAMRKLGAANSAELARIATLAGIAACQDPAQQEPGQ